VFRVPGLGFRVSGSELRVLGSGFQVSGLGFRIPCSRFQVPGSRFRVSGFGYRVPGSRFQVSDFGVRWDLLDSHAEVVQEELELRVQEVPIQLDQRGFVLLRGLVFKAHGLGSSIGRVPNLRTTTVQNCEAVPRRARM
jgi:hypothetical protein